MTSMALVKMAALSSTFCSIDCVIRFSRRLPLSRLRKSTCHRRACSRRKGLKRVIGAMTFRLRLVKIAPILTSAGRSSTSCDRYESSMCVTLNNTKQVAKATARGVRSSYSGPTGHRAISLGDDHRSVPCRKCMWVWRVGAKIVRPFATDRCSSIGGIMRATTATSRSTTEPRCERYLNCDSCWDQGKGVIAFPPTSFRGRPRLASSIRGTCAACC